MRSLTLFELSSCLCFYFLISSWCLSLANAAIVHGMFGSHPNIDSQGVKSVVWFFMVLITKLINFRFSSHSLFLSDMLVLVRLFNVECMRSICYHSTPTKCLRTLPQIWFSSLLVQIFSRVLCQLPYRWLHNIHIYRYGERERSFGTDWMAMNISIIKINTLQIRSKLRTADL